MTRKLVIGLTLFCLAVLATSCVQPSPPKAEFVEYKIRDVTSQGINVDFYFEVENANPVGIDVSQYSYTIYINKTEFLSQTKGGFNIPANSKKLIKIPVQLGYRQIFGSLLAVAEALARGEDTISYDIEGSLSAGAMGISVHTPIKAQGKIPIPKDIKL